MSEVAALIAAACKRREITQSQLAVYVCGSQTTFYRRIRKPGEFTVDELNRLFVKTNMNRGAREEFWEACGVSE